MRYKFTESKANYETYEFPYAVNAYFEEDKGDLVKDFLNQGLLPTRTSEKNRFYMARSVRVNLEEFEASSENRRILKKTEYFTYESMPIKDFTFDFSVIEFCKNFFDNRFGKGKMSAQGLRRIFTESWNNTVYIFRDNREGDNKIIGYAAIYKDGSGIHYAYPFYDLDYFKDSIGARMMLTAIMEAKDANMEYAYLGTLYEKSALYKTEFKGFEWWNGSEWNKDVHSLKEIIDKNSEII